VKIQLHGILTTNGNSDQMSRLGIFLQSLGGWLGSGGHAIIDAGTAIKNLARQSKSVGTSTVHVVYEMPALNRLQSDAYVNGNQPLAPHMLDAANWNAYVSASKAVQTDPLAYLQLRVSNNFYIYYSTWEAFNRITNGLAPNKNDRYHTIGLLTASDIAALHSQPPFSDALSDDIQ